MLFIDTSAYLARYLAKDQYHDPAMAFWEELKTKHEGLVTSNFVLDETATLLGRRAGHVFASNRLKAVYASSVLQIWRPDRDDELRAIDWFAKFQDQDVSFTDCISFTLMKRGRIHHVFSFDRHFDTAGFKRLPILPYSHRA